MDRTLSMLRHLGLIMIFSLSIVSCGTDQTANNVSSEPDASEIDSGGTDTKESECSSTAQQILVDERSFCVHDSTDDVDCGEKFRLEIPSLVVCSESPSINAETADEIGRNYRWTGTPPTSPCSAYTDCQVSVKCACPQPGISGVSTWHCPESDGDSLAFCVDSFGGPGGEPFPMCISNTCGYFGSNVCDVVEESPQSGVFRLGVDSDCRADTDCELTTRFNPCGCVEAIKRAGSETFGAANPNWDSAVMASVWAVAAESCGDADCGQCPGGAPIAKCESRRCVVEFE